MNHILIVEDESLVALEISRFVKDLGYDVSKIVASSKKALEVMKEQPIDAVLMDVNIKGDEDGITCAAKIKALKNIPIIYISAFSDDETLDRAIETNPTSYLVKPFNRKELQVALKIATKRNRRREDKNPDELRGDIIFDSSFSFDTQEKLLIHFGEIIHLTKRERELLSLLVEHKNQIIPFEQIEYEIWPDKDSNENTRRALVSKLRSKLNHQFLETIHSLGYRLNI